MQAAPCWHPHLHRRELDGTLLLGTSWQANVCSCSGAETRGLLCMRMRMPVLHAQRDGGHRGCRRRAAERSAGGAAAPTVLSREHGPRRWPEAHQVLVWGSMCVLPTLCNLSTL